MLKKTKIICTLGPATEDDEILSKMIDHGMNVARFNFSHGTHESHKATLERLIRVREKKGVHIAALLDTKGPEIRVKTFKEPVTLKEGSTFTLTTGEREGDESGCSVTYPNLPKDVSVGSRILLDDGLIELVVKEISDENIVCTVKNTGLIKSNKGVNLPGTRISMPYLSKKDEEDVVFAIENEFDFIAASFVSRAQDILDIRRVLDEHKCDKIQIIAKIENQSGVDNIEEILAVSDGIMVARGDMGVEIDLGYLPSIQKKLIHCCYSAGKPVITATQMLESMIVNPRPTRAEVSDVANAIYDGTSAVMLSGETAAGKYPVEALATMANIALDTEADIDYRKRFRQRRGVEHLSVADAISHSACLTAIDIEASAIITVTRSGMSARLLSKYRPEQPIFSCVTEAHAARKLSLSWGVYPILMPLMQSTDELLKVSEEMCLNAGYIKSGDLVVTTAGLPIGESGTTNMVKVHLVGESLANGLGIGKGKASGTVCVCRTEDDVEDRFKTGDVLVIPSTSNAILKYIINAAAVITEESGANSHAAIVGLTLNKPVIVGVSGAIKSLKSGMKVAVDAERGIIQKLEK